MPACIKTNEGGGATSATVIDSMMDLQTGSQPVIHHHRHNLKHRYELIKTLGEGTYGKVKLAVELTTGEKVAIKYIRKSKIQDEQDLQRIRREINVMAQLTHPHIINVREVFENKDKIVLVMDYASSGELYDYINSRQRLGDREARRLFRQIVAAVHSCHQNGIVHRDLKLENIVLDDNRNIQIADFGLSNYFSSDNKLKTFCGSPLYASPEIVNGTPYHGPEIDCWSLGVLLYTLVYGAMPFDGSDFKSLKRQITNGDYYEPATPSDAAGLIRKLLTPDPAKRGTLDDIVNNWWVNTGYTCNPVGAPYKGFSSPSSLSYLDIFHRFSGSKNVYADCVKSRQCFSSRTTTRPPRDRFCDGAEYKLTQPIKLHVSKLESQTTSLSLSQTEASEKCSLSRMKFTIQSERVRNLSAPSNRTSSSETEKKMSDSDSKPKRGILKKKDAFNNSDSGCALEEVMSQTSSGQCSPVDKPDPDPIGSSYIIDDIETVLDSPLLPLSSGACAGVDQSKTSCSSSSDLLHNICSNDVRNPNITPDSIDNNKPDKINDSGYSTCSDNHRSNSNDCLTSSSNANFSSNASHTFSTDTMLSTMSTRKGILKRPKCASAINSNSINRHSLGSTGSNSSGDLLDLSEDLLNQSGYVCKYQQAYHSRESSDSGNNCEDAEISDILETSFERLGLSRGSLWKSTPNLAMKSVPRHTNSSSEMLGIDYYEAKAILRRALNLTSQRM